MPSEQSECDPDLGREICTSVPEHEVLLSFNSDWMAEAFESWWHRVGRKSWLRWVKDNQEEFHD